VWVLHLFSNSFLVSAHHKLLDYLAAGFNLTGWLDVVFLGGPELSVAQKPWRGHGGPKAIRGQSRRAAVAQQVGIDSSTQQFQRELPKAKIYRMAGHSMPVLTRPSTH